MVTIEKQSGNFVFEVKGLHKLWALKSQLTIPVENITNVYPNEENLKWIAGLRNPGTHIPGLITAGTYIVKDGTIFCNVADQNKSIVVELRDEHYKKLIIEVDNVEEALDLLKGV
jgi:hypothetical protein